MSHQHIEKEGVIKYRLNFQEEDLSKHNISACLKELNASRSALKEYALIGQDEARYGGDGFGNISLRLEGLRFLISGSQTGHLKALSEQDVAIVEDFEIASNQLRAKGLSKPSSESMTHGVAYQSLSQFNAVAHIHSPDIWNAIDRLNLPFTSKAIPYGTPQMAKAVNLLLTQIACDSSVIVFGMKGHQDGIVAVGKDLQTCTNSLLNILKKII